MTEAKNAIHVKLDQSEIERLENGDVVILESKKKTVFIEPTGRKQE